MADQQTKKSRPSRELKPEGNDLLARIILAGTKRQYWLLFCGFLVLSSLAPIAAALERNFTNSALRIDTLHDYGYWNQFFLLLPFLIWFTRYYFAGLEDALRRLIDRGVVDVDLTLFFPAANKIFRTPWLKWSPYILGVTVTLLVFVTILNGAHGTWNSPKVGSSPTPAMWLTIPPTFLLYCVLGHCVGRIACLWSVIHLFMGEKSVVNINPLHPDGAGGLAPLGEFSFRVVPGCLVVGAGVLIGCAVNRYQYELPAMHPLNFIMLIGYAIALAIVFFLPLYAARDRMQKAKSDVLGRIGGRCNELVQATVADVDRHRNAGELKQQNELLRERVEAIEAMQKLYKVAAEMPVYPFNTRTVVRFMTSVMWPFAIWMAHEVYAIVKAHYRWWE